MTSISKQIIVLQDGSLVEINGGNVKHIKENGQVLYDSTKRVLYGQEQIDALKKKVTASRDDSVEARLERFRVYLREDIEE